MLQRHINIGADFFVSRDRVQQPLRNLIRIGVKETHPAQFLDGCKFFEQQCQSVFQPEILAVAGRVLADQRDLAHAGMRQSLGFRNHRFKPP